jgi:hypothetical protein
MQDPIQEDNEGQKFQSRMDMKLPKVRLQAQSSFQQRPSWGSALYLIWPVTTVMRLAIQKVTCKNSRWQILTRGWQLDDTLELVRISKCPTLTRAPTSSASRYWTSVPIVFKRCRVSLGDTVLYGFAILGVDHGLIFVG